MTCGTSIGCEHDEAASANEAKWNGSDVREKRNSGEGSSIEFGSLALEMVIQRAFE
jgi:hypothetical protein